SLALGIVLALAIQSPVQSAPVNATFIVNSTLDEAALSLSSSTCRSTPSNKCTLRAAVQAANAGYALAPGSQYTIVLPATDVSHVVGKTYPLTLAGDHEDNGAKGDLDIKSNL